MIDGLIPHPLGFLVDPEAGIVYGRYGRPVGSKDTCGYVQINGISRGVGMLSCHRLIWETANGPIPAGLEINHKNGVRDDNRLSNLEIVTHQENILHAYRTGLKTNRGEKHPSHKVTEAQVREMRALSRRMRPRQIAELYGISRRQVAAIVSGESWSHVPMEVAS